MRRLGWMLALALLGAGANLTALERLPQNAVPDALRDWVPWVLHEVPEHDCPYRFNADQQRCLWSGPLTLTLTDRGGSFAVGLTAYAPGWIALPGGAAQWPLDVELDGRPAVVTTHDQRPAVAVVSGRHQLSGRFAWPALPDSLTVPPEFGLISATVNGVARAGAANNGQLWLKAPVVAAADTDRLDVQVFRQLIDELPMTVITQIDLDVAGAQREITLRGAMLADSVPVRLDSPLPARLEADGALRLQLRPGHWQLQLQTRQRQPVSGLALPALSAPWPATEVWTFAARTALRLVEVHGGSAVDPRQTSLPPDWQNLPAWRMNGDDALEFAVQRRGDPEPAPDQLTLTRELWLDFDGGGYTVLDHLRGRVFREWRLRAASPLVLGRVLLNGEPQFITHLGDGAAGVEVRRGALDLQAESRLDGVTAAVPAVGWAHDVNALQATLHLPPGWRLWAARGVDNVPDTWIERWSLLDLFLVLIASIAMARLCGWRPATVLLLTLALIWHEPEAPQQAWLHVLAAVALLRVLPAGGVARLVQLYRGLALLLLVVQSVGFMVEQVRLGLYPQLAQPFAEVGAPLGAMVGQAARLRQAPPAAERAPAPAAETDGAVQAMPEGAPLAAKSATAGIVAGGRGGLPLLSKRLATSPSVANLAGAAGAAGHDVDLEARIQTGPGLPVWRWSTVPLHWTGPVKQDQSVTLWLLSPRANLALATLRVLLLALVLAGLLRVGVGGDTTWLTRLRGSVAPALLLLFALALVPPPAAAALPGTTVLQALRERLTRAPDCLPQCAEIARMRADLHDANLSLQLEVQTAAAVAVPLPGAADQWTPRTVLVDGQLTTGLYRDAAGVVWLELGPGIHQVTLAGGVPAGASFQVPFALKPQHLEVAVSGWSVSGQRTDGGAEAQLIFTRLVAAEHSADSTLEPRALPPFFRVERTLHLGLDWRVETQVTRLTPPDSAAVLAIPLLPGEAVTTPGVRVADGRVAVDLAATTRVYAWSSVLAKQDVLRLRAPLTSDWVETWRADISPLWHAQLGGLAVVQHQDESGQWLPTWQPWSDEEITLTLTRPAGVDGRSLTIDASELQVIPAARATAVNLSFTLRSSQGGQHPLTLPADAVLSTIAINGVPQPIRQEGRQVTLPLVPGEQHFDLAWRSDAGIVPRFFTPAWSLGAPSVNASLKLILPDDRWTLLLGGPRLGPAVLFWGMLLVLALVAFGLGQTRATPLSGWQWLLLAVGLSQTPLVYAAVVVTWLFALAARARLPATSGRLAFNCGQIGLALLTVLALALLFGAIKQGLLGGPQMQIAGNGSSATVLNWFQDRVGGDYPRAWVVSVPLWYYRVLMLAWALWLAFALLDWLRWGWRCFANDGLWRAAPLRPAPPAADVAASNPQA